MIGSVVKTIARDIAISIIHRVTDEERKLIEHKMSLVPTKQIGAHLRKMAIDGYIIYTYRHKQH